MSVANTLNIARKEFEDLISNKYVLVVIAIYLLIILSSFFDINDLMSNGTLQNDQLFSIMLGWSSSIISYGSMLGLMIGFSLISSEKFGNALNTLVVKPVYRDTIINGKLIACICFLLCVFGLSVAIYISLLLILFGGAFTGLMTVFLERLPIIFIISLLYVLIFTSISILVSILIRRQSVALLLDILVFILLRSIVPTVSLAGNVSRVLGGQAYNIVVNMSPDWALFMMSNGGIYDPKVDISMALYINRFEFLILILYVITLLVLSYLSFIRRDIA
jgi:ABC-2 type transport system permease protein